MQQPRFASQPLAYDAQGLPLPPYRVLLCLLYPNDAPPDDGSLRLATQLLADLGAADWPLGVLAPESVLAALRRNTDPEAWQGFAAASRWQAWRWLTRFGKQFQVLHTLTPQAHGLAVFTAFQHLRPVLHTLRSPAVPSGSLAIARFQLTDCIVSPAPAWAEPIRLACALDAIPCVDEAQDPTQWPPAYVALYSEVIRALPLA